MILVHDAGYTKRLVSDRIILPHTTKKIKFYIQFSELMLLLAIFNKCQFVELSCEIHQHHFEKIKFQVLHVALVFQ